MPNENTGNLITAIKVAKNSVKITLSNSDTLVVSHDDYVSNYYFVGKELTNKEIETLKSSMQDKAVYDYAYKLLANGRYTEYKLREKLKFKTKNKELIDRVINKLKDIHLIDDISYIEDFVEQETSKHYGHKKIINDLLIKGISKESLQDIPVNPSVERENALYWLKIGENKYAKYNSNKKKSLFYNFLISKGFSNEIAKEVTNKLSATSEKENFTLCKNDYKKAKNRLIKKYQGRELKEKTIASLLSKGYSMKEIIKVMEE